MGRYRARATKKIKRTARRKRRNSRAVCERSRCVSCGEC